MRLALVPALFVLIPAQARAIAPDVQQIFAQHCLGCHSATKAAGGLALTSRQNLLDRRVLVPGDPANSLLYRRLLLPSGTPGAMPPTGPRLPPDALKRIQDWIATGAAWPAATVTAKPPATEQDIVRGIFDRIAEHNSIVESRRYRVTIPHTTVSYDMVPIAAGDFMMGSPDSDPARQPDEQPAHKVHVDRFWMQAREVTWDEYRLFMFAVQAGELSHPDQLVDAVSRPTRPYVEMSFGMGINRYPAISMTQHAASKYAEWLSARTGEFYRLPTEAEWEYACRAGSTTPYFFGTDSSQLANYAWYSADSQGKYQQVGAKKPNPWGLYDMLGNAMEWTLDQYAPYTLGGLSNPFVVSTKPYPQSVRGGSWNDSASACRCAARAASDPSWKQQDPQLPKSIWYHTDAQWLGFRLVRPAKIPDATQMFHYWNNGVEHDEQ